MAAKLLTPTLKDGFYRDWIVQQRFALLFQIDLHSMIQIRLIFPPGGASFPTPTVLLRTTAHRSRSKDSQKPFTCIFTPWNARKLPLFQTAISLTCPCNPPY